MQPEINVTVLNNDVINMSYGDVISSDNITISGAVDIPSGAILRVRSETTTINTGFTAEQGAEFEINNESVLDCP